MLRIRTVANTPRDPDSGAAGTVFQTNRALRALGHRVDETWEPDLGPRKIAHGNLHSLLEQPRRYRREVLRAHANQRYDLFLMSQPQAWLAARALRRARYDGVILNRSHGVEPRVIEALAPHYARRGRPRSRNELLTRMLDAALNRQWKEIARYADGFVVGCHVDREYLETRFSIAPERIVVAPHGVSDQMLDAPETDIPDRFERFLHVGQYAFYKGSDDLIEIATRVLENISFATFTWVCPERHHAEIRSRFPKRVSGRLVLRGWGPADELIELYEAHGIFLFPSLFEGFGKAPFEAMARRACVIGSREGGMRDLIHNGCNGLVFEAGDVEAFSDAVIGLLEDPTRAERMGQEGARTAASLRWSGVAEAILAHYKSLAGSG